MAVTIQLPAGIEENLRREFSNLDQTATEAMLVELYRQHKLTHFELSEALGLSRYEADGLLKRHNVTEDSLSIAELDSELDFFVERKIKT